MFHLTLSLHIVFSRDKRYFNFHQITWWLIRIAFISIRQELRNRLGPKSSEAASSRSLIVPRQASTLWMVRTRQERAESSNPLWCPGLWPRRSGQVSRSSRGLRVHGSHCGVQWRIHERSGRIVTAAS